ncbi:MAG TPA: GNAT family N-acetyltransferase [Candidatus Hydrogenedentes bacterium]|nr:GNAT family N-acetyltransferase [Candidatus Hydrogenedentota bacterium]HOL75543.1 GNAT family N-acetyltransferase [Candidatus Hydrogenedentota bacterium]HPO86015.1 GNAT family N-acetyltransferase [Candidatus Hydrogenedentota bacterium]
MGFLIKGVETDEELRLATDLIARVHKVQEPTALDWLYQGSQRYPNFRREHTRILTVNGEIASALRLTTDAILMGESRLKMGGLGWVSTLEKYRGKGFCSALVRDTMDYMRSNNYHVSMLFGIPEFYERFGYCTCLVDYLVEMDTAEALTFDSPFSLRLACAHDIPAISKIHNATNAAIPCSILRTTAHFKNRWDRWRDWYCLADCHGKVEGYFIAHKHGTVLEVDDVGIAEPIFCAAVVGAVARIASEQGAAAIQFYVPPQHVLARYLLQFRSRHEMRIERNAGGMLTFVNVLETFENLIPEWESLLTNSVFRDAKCEFTFCVRDEVYRIRVNHGAIDVSAFPGKNKITISSHDLMHLITGYRYAEDILTFAGANVAPEIHNIIMTLFPKRAPYVWRFDRF